MRKRRANSLPAGSLFMVLVTALVALGVGYGLWSRSLLIKGIVNTGNVDAMFKGAFTDDDGRVDDPGRDGGDVGACPINAGGNTSCDPAASGDDPKERHDKDVGRCTVEVAADGNSATITQSNAYPGYFCTAWLGINNKGSVPVKIASAKVNGQAVTPSLPVPFDLSGDGQADVAVHLTGVDICQQIDPGQTVLMDVDQQVLQDAPQNTTMTYLVEVQLNQWNAECTPPQVSLPVFTVTQAGLTQAQADGLAAALGISGNILAADGAARFTSGNFLFVPMTSLGVGEREEEGQETVLEGFDFAALQKMTVLDGGRATGLVEGALQEAKLPIAQWGPVKALARTGHSTLEAVDAKGQPLMTTADVRLDTHVGYNLTLNGIPLVGPGAKVKVVLDGAGQVTQLTYAMRGLAQGQSVPIIPPAEARQMCQGALGGNRIGQDQASALRVQPRLMYYAPPLELASVQTLFPYYACEGSIMVEGRDVPLRRALLPAVRDVPQAKLSVQVDGRTVNAQAAVTGGTPPYSFHWGSSTTPVTLPNESKVSYLVAPGAEGKEGIAEVLSLIVRDANGLEAHASQEILIGLNQGWIPVPIKVLAAPFLVPGGLDVGTEWIGTCQGLNGSSGNAAGFVNKFANAGVPVRFNWGNQNAWERDFVDLNLRADALDQIYVDNVDFTFYTGHANGDGFTFCSNQADGFLGYGDGVRWGDSPDLEWLVIAACGPLQLDSGGLRWWQRWGPTFDGLHLFMGYQTVTYDNTDEGRLVAQYSLAGWTVRQAWIQTAIDVQSPSEVWAVMGVIGSGGWVNYNDHLWGYGSVGPDIRGAAIQGYWIIWGPS